MGSETDGTIMNYFDKTPYDNIEHKIPLKTLFTTEDSKNPKSGGVYFGRENCYTKNEYILIKQRVEGQHYIEYHTKNIQQFNTDLNLYEVVCSGKCIKLAFDIDDKEEGILINAIIEFCELFKIFMSGHITRTKPITYTVMTSDEPTATIDLNIPYKSYHIVFNIYTKKNNYNKQIISDFLEKNGDHIPFYKTNKSVIDMSYYSTMKYSRAVGQSKGRILKNGVYVKTRTDTIRPINFETEQYTDVITSDMFITFVNKDTDIFYDYIEPPTITKIYETYNIIYSIPHYQELIMDWINELTENDFISEWIETIHYLLHILKIGGLSTDVNTSEILKLFLQKSRVSHYNTEDMTEQNITFIKNILETNKHKRLDDRNPIFSGIGIRELCDYEITGIYKQQNKLPSERIYLVLQSSKAFAKGGSTQRVSRNDYEICGDTPPTPTASGIATTMNPYTRGDIKYTKSHDNSSSKIVIIQTQEIEQYDFIYNVDTKTILINVYIYKSKGLKCVSEYNIPLHTINNYSMSELQFCNENYIEITDWNDKRLLSLNRKMDLNIIIEAPTSCGKTYNQMRNRLRGILQYAERRVCVITDTRSLTNATTEMIRTLFNELNIPLTHFKNYLNYNKDYNKGEEEDVNDVSNDNTRLLIVCCDSLMKYTQRFNAEDNLVFTDVIIDEYQNITSGIIKTISNDYVETSRQKELMNTLYDVIKNAKSVSIYDADIYTHDIKRLKNITGKKFDYVKFTGFKQKVDKIVLVLYDDMIGEITRNYEQGKPQSISVSTKSRADYLYNEFIKKGISSNYPIVVITREGAKDSRITDQSQADSKKLKERLCSNTELWREYALVIYNSTITTGISFNTKEGENPYFYRHYSILTPSSTRTPHSTARGQMDRRVRQTQTQECYIAIEGDSLKTLTIKPIDYDLYFKKHKNELYTLILKRTLYDESTKKNESGEILLPNSIKDLQGHIRELNKELKFNDEDKNVIKKQIKKAFNKIDTLIQAEEVYFELNMTKKAREETDNNEFISFYLKLMRKWGVAHITSNIFQKLTEIEQISLEKCEKDKHIYTKEQADFESFNTERSIIDYNDNDTHNRDEYMNELVYTGYGQYHAKLYGLCERYFNQVAFSLLEDKYRTREALQSYTKLYDYEYYDILRSVILKNVLTDIDDQAKKELNRTDRNLKSDMCYIVNACIMFELFKGGHIIKKGGTPPLNPPTTSGIENGSNALYDYNEFMNDMIIIRQGEAEIIKPKILMDGLITELKPICRYLYKCGSLKLKSSKASFEALSITDYIDIAFNYFNTNVKIETQEDGRILLSFKSIKGTPFRLQKQNYEIESIIEGEKLLIHDTDIDDYKTLSDLEPYKSQSGLLIPMDYMPKIKRTPHKINDRLYKLIQHYVVEKKQKDLFDALQKQTSKIKRSFIKIPYEEAKQIKSEFETLMGERCQLTIEKCGLALGGTINTPLINNPTEFKPARRFYNWTVSNEGVIYNEVNRQQDVITISHAKIEYKERPIDYAFTDQGGDTPQTPTTSGIVKGDKSVSYVSYRNRLFRINLIVAEAFMTEYDSEKSYIVAIDGDYTNNDITNIKVINDKEQFDTFMKAQKQTKSVIKKEATALNRKDYKKEQKNEKRDCSICGGSYIVKNKSAHEKTDKHRKAL